MNVKENTILVLQLHLTLELEDLEELSAEGCYKFGVGGKTDQYSRARESPGTHLHPWVGSCLRVQCASLKISQRSGAFPMLGACSLAL